MILEFSNFLAVFGLMMIVMNSVSTPDQDMEYRTDFGSEGARSDQWMGDSVHHLHLRLGIG